MLNKEILGYYCDNKKTYPSIRALVKYNKYSIILFRSNWSNFC